MPSSYNRIVGQSAERLAALSDGVFAVAMTLLVLDLHVPLAAPSGPPIQTDQDLLTALIRVAPSLLTYFMSFLTLGIFWLGQQTQLNYFARSDRNMTWLHLGFLLIVSIMPFSTALLASYITFRLALFVYWLNIVLLGGLLYLSWIYAERNKLLRDEVTEAIGSATKRRIINYQVLYLIGALLCLFSTYASIVFIVMVQLNAALAFMTRVRRSA